MLKIDENSKNYAATIIKLPPKIDVAGLDNLKSVTVFGNQCLVSKDSSPDELYIYFPAESRLSESFLSCNNLYRNSLNNKNSDIKGFFEDTGRVKTIKFKGVVSSCFIIPVKSLYNMYDGDNSFDTCWEQLKIGDEFTHIDGEEICRKYVVKNQQSTGNKESRHNKKLERFDRLIPNQFRFHQDTAQFAKSLHNFTLDDIIVITDKWHGTSGVFGNVLINKELKWYQKLLKKLNFNIVDREYDIIYSSRKVVKNQYINKEADGGYYNEDIWGIVKKELEGKIEEGITLYGEIVGFLQSGKEIQSGYDYGCLPGTHKFLVYRITYTKPNGEVIEFSWQQIKDYCKKYGIEIVKELYFGRLDSLYHGLTGKSTFDFWQDDLLSTLQNSFNLEQECQHCVNNVPAEGICIRIDGKETYYTYKLKSKNFLLRESKELDKGEINIEDNQEAAL